MISPLSKEMHLLTFPPTSALGIAWYCLVAVLGIPPHKWVRYDAVAGLSLTHSGKKLGSYNTMTPIQIPKMPNLVLAISISLWLSDTLFKN